jgi:hypothetical protein
MLQMENLEFSEKFDLLAAALAAFHLECPKVRKTTYNKHHEKMYADLGNILQVVNPVLAKHGLSVVQIPLGELTLITMLLHTSGQYIKATTPIRVMEVIVKRGNGKEIPDTIGVTPQAYGSGLTYQRRYTLTSMLSICLDEDDDDGEGAEEGARPKSRFLETDNPVPKDAFDAKPKQESKPETKEAPVELLSDDKVNEIMDKIRSCTNELLPKAEAALSNYGIKGAITKSDWATLSSAMLSRMITVAESPSDLGKVTSKLAAYRSKGLVSEEAFAKLNESLTKRTEEFKV